MFDVLYVPVTDQSPVVRLLRVPDRETADEALRVFMTNDPQGAPEFTYTVKTVPADALTGEPLDKVPPGRPACPLFNDGAGCGSVRLTWTSGEVFRCRSCGGEFTGENTGWVPV